jgi:hypothetical protein
VLKFIPFQRNNSGLFFYLSWGFADSPQKLYFVLGLYLNKEKIKIKY